MGFDMMRSYRLPPQCDGLSGDPFSTTSGDSQPRYGPRKASALCVEPLQELRTGEVGKMVSAFAVFLICGKSHRLRLPLQRWSNCVESLWHHHRHPKGKTPQQKKLKGRHPPGGGWSESVPKFRGFRPEGQNRGSAIRFLQISSEFWCNPDHDGIHRNPKACGLAARWVTRTLETWTGYRAGKYNAPHILGNIIVAIAGNTTHACIFVE